MRVATPAPGEDTLELEQFEQFDMRTPGAAIGAAYAGAAPAFAAFDRARFSMCLLLGLNIALRRKCGVFCEFVCCLPAGSWSCSCRWPVAKSEKCD